MLDVVENLSVTSEENAFSSIVPTWIESDFLKGSMWLGRSHQRVGNKYFLASRKLGKIRFYRKEAGIPRIAWTIPSQPLSTAASIEPPPQKVLKAFWEYPNGL